jgi:RimJ/RimL family protein N-acetyltransferase
MQADFSPHYSTRQITVDDWQSYKDFCFRFSGTEDSAFCNWQNPNIPESWKSIFDDKTSIFFGLFDKDKMIGMAHIKIKSPEEACFSGLMIEPEYQGRGLANCLHEIRRRYLKGIDFNGDIYTQILSTNNSSLKAAQRNGFEIIKTAEEGGDGWKATYYYLQLDKSLIPK